jgi:16S rRNA (guanine966-N2)-methyltransferase
MNRSAKRPASKSQLRIIGGRWRGRKLSFTPAPGLRPTTDRVRETLFNWLAPRIHGASCLDLFAGSGALGLEALSRGAASCDFVDISTAALKQIDGHLRTLDASAYGHCHPLPALQFLQSCNHTFDIGFIDPPFGQDLVAPTCALLVNRQLLSPAALVYVESAAAETCPTVPPDWKLHRDKVAGGVAYRLFVTPG